LIRTVIEDLQPGINSHKIILQGSTDVMVLADEDRLAQVIANLISNAVKYSPDADRVVITINKKKKNSISLTVKDFGIGISRKYQEKIFERFFRGGSENKTFPGLGIGLYVSDQIVKRHNGRLWVESEEGKGSTFHLDLPLRQAWESRIRKRSDTVDAPIKGDSEAAAPGL